MTEMATPLNPVTGYAPYQSAQLGWTYDSFGNYVNEGLSGNTSFSMPQPAPYNFTSVNQIVGFTYDVAGNQTSDPVLGPNTYVYDAENRVYSSGNGSTTYLYDAEGRRVAKYSGGTLTNQYLLGLGGEQVTELDGNGGWLHSNAYAAGKLLATYYNAGLHFQFSDWLGSRRVQADGLGNVEETCLNLPFGDMLNCSGPGSDATEQHFTGKFHDNESGLDYFGARYLNSGVGRWMSPDWSAKEEPVPYAKLDNPQSLNLYGYVGNNPLSMVDSDGHQQEEDAEGEAELAMARNARNALRPVQISPREAEQLGWPTSQLSPVAEAFRDRYTSGAGGRWGSNLTRNQNATIADLFTGVGYKIVGGVEGKEEWLPGPGGGSKGATYVDLTVRKGDETIRIQTVTMGADGKLDPKEAAAAARIKSQFPHDKLLLVPKTAPRRPASSDPVIQPKVK